METVKNWSRLLKEQKKQSLLIYTISAAIVILGFTPFLIFWPSTIKLDWDYFNAYSLLIRSEVLHYHVFPIHDPWMGGGLDLLTNGQNRLFSPLILLNILVEPVLANVFTLMVYSILGAWGCIRLAKMWNWKPTSALLFVSLFSWCSWFSLHFSEGHIPFAGFQLLPCLQYLLITQSDSFRKRNLLGLLFLFLMAEGQVYPFVFFILYTLSWALAAPGKRTWIKRPLEWILPILSIAMIVSARAIPTLGNPIKRELIFDAYSFSFTDIMQAFFSPNQSVLIKMSEDSPWRFHEYGCYLGIILTIIFIATLGLLKKRKLPSVVNTFLIVALFWLWVGLGFGGFLNPWTMFQKIPVLNRLHIQSRTLILFFFPFLTISIFGWEAVREKLMKRWQTFIVLILLLECLVIRFGTFYETLQAQAKPGPEGALITSDKLEKTEPYGQKYEFYLYRPNHGSVLTYEPSAPETHVKAFGQPTYKGEVYTPSEDPGVVITSYTPGLIRLSYNLKNLEKITVNTNFLHGWKSTEKSSTGVVSQSPEGLVEWKPNEKLGSVELVYRPSYIPLVFSLTLIGWLLMFYGTVIVDRRKPPRV